MSNRNPKKTFALLTIPQNEKYLEVLTFNDAEIICDNKYSGKEFMQAASTYLFELKNKNLEGVILDFYCHDDNDFLQKIRDYFFEFCESKYILFRLVYQNVIFTSMLLYHSELDFNPEDTVYSIWIKKDNFVSYKLEESTLYFINEMRITDDFAENEEFDKLLDCENPKFLVLGSRSSDVRLRQLKDRFKAQKTKVMFCTYEDCLKKSASHYLSRFIRANNWRWNFKLSDSTEPKRGGIQFPRRKKSNTALICAAMVAVLALVIATSYFISNSPAELKGDSYYEDITKIAKNDNEIYGMIIGVEDNVKLTIYGAQTKHLIGVINRQKDIFIVDLIQILDHRKFKAVIIQIDEILDYVDYYNRLNNLLKFLEIPYTFMGEVPFKYSCLLTGANIQVNLNETIRFVMMYPQDKYEIKELQYTDVGYQGVIQRDIPETLDTDIINPDILRHKVMGNSNPAKIVLYSQFSGTPAMKIFKDSVLKDDSEMVIAIEEDYRKFESNFVYEKVRWMFDKSYTRFHIPPGASKKYMIGFKCGEKDYPLIVCEKNEVLPFKKNLIIPKTPFKYFIGTTNQYDYGLVKQKYLEQLDQLDAHAYQISMEIDTDNFVNTSSTAGVYLSLQKFQEILDDSFSSSKQHYPVIAFYGDLSFIYVYDETYGYHTVDSWKGDYGRGLFVSLNEQKPKFYEKAAEAFQSTCSSVVHDIIKVMSTAPEDIDSLKPTYGYDLTVDSNDQILYNINSYNGTTKQASPIDLMSTILNDHLKAIERETNEMPEKVLFYLFDEFDKTAKNRVKNGLKECCKKVGIECGFVKTLSTKFLLV